MSLGLFCYSATYNLLGSICSAGSRHAEGPKHQEGSEKRLHSPMEGFLTMLRGLPQAASTGLRAPLAEARKGSLIAYYFSMPTSCTSGRQLERGTHHFHQSGTELIGVAFRIF